MSPYRLILLLACLVAFQSRQVSAQVTDSLEHQFPQRTDSLKPLPVQPKQWYQTTVFKTAAVPLLLVGLGISEINNHGLYSSYQAKRDLLKEFPGVKTRLDDNLPSMPAVLAAGLSIGGVKGRSHPIDAGIMFFTSGYVGNFVGSKLKGATRILRPDASDFQSFPSNHTIAAFVAAEFLHQEYKGKSPWISVAGYAMASTVGSIRMLENHHWLSDVLAGAGIGMLTVKTTYLVYPWLRSKLPAFGSFKSHKKLLIAPTAINGKIGAAAALQF